MFFLFHSGLCLYLHQHDLFQQRNLSVWVRVERESSTSSGGTCGREIKDLLLLLGIRYKSDTGVSGRNLLSFIKYLTPPSTDVYLSLSTYIIQHNGFRRIQKVMLFQLSGLSASSLWPYGWLWTWLIKMESTCFFFVLPNPSQCHKYLYVAKGL